MRRHAAIRIDLVRRKRQDRALGGRLREPFERAEEERRRRRRSARGRDRSGRRTGRRRAASRARRRRRTAPSPTRSARRRRAPATSIAAARDGGLQNGAKVQEVEVVTTGRARRTRAAPNIQCKRSARILPAHRRRIPGFRSSRRSRWSNSPPRPGSGRLGRRAPRRCRGRRWRLRPSRRPYQHVRLKRGDERRAASPRRTPRPRRRRRAPRGSRRARASGVIGRSGPLLARTDRSRVDADDQRVAERARLLQVADVAGMQQVEDAVGEDDRLAGRLAASPTSACASATR